MSEQNQERPPANWRKGLKRLAIAYFGVWTIVGLWGFLTQRTAEEQYLYNIRSSPNFERSADLAVWNDQMNLGVTMVEAAIIMGVLLPIAAAIIGGIALWIYRGFHSNRVQ